MAHRDTNRPAARLLAALLALALASCMPHPHTRAELLRLSDRYRHDQEAESIKVARSGDTIYQRRMADLLRRSRLVPVDSLARLTVSLATVPAREAHGVHDAMFCETYRLMRHHGGAALTLATKRFADSLRRTGFDEDAIPPANQLQGVYSPACMNALDTIPLVADSLSDFVYPTRFMNPPRGERPAVVPATTPSRIEERIALEGRVESLFVAASRDTVYQRRMRDLWRRSLAIRTDSLARLHVAMAAAPPAERAAVGDAITCEAGRLLRANGAAPFTRAMNRMRDSLGRTGLQLPVTIDRMGSLHGTPMPLTTTRCYALADSLPRVPDSLASEVRP